MPSNAEVDLVKIYSQIVPQKLSLPHHPHMVHLIITKPEGAGIAAVYERDADGFFWVCPEHVMTAVQLLGATIEPSWSRKWP